MKAIKIKTVLAAIVALAAFGMGNSLHAGEKTENPWRLGVQAYSFRQFTFFETLDKLSDIDVRYVEAYPGQKIGGGIKGKTHHKMDADTRRKLQEKLKETNIELVSYGVVKGKNKKDWRKIFEFAQAMGIETVVSEPKPKDLDLIEKLCKEYQIKFAIHNHARPKRYWNPDQVLEVLKGHSKLLGASPDNGHWARSGLDMEESFKKLDGRLISIHLKDVDKSDDLSAHCAPFGEGVCDMPAIFEELDRQDYSGMFIIEYESDPGNPVPGIRKSVEYFRSHIPDDRRPAKKGACTAGAGFEPLFEDDLSNAIFPGKKWKMEDGVLEPTGKGDIWTKERYGDFVLEMDFKCEDKTNSGVFLRCDDIDKWLHTAIEVQILQPDNDNKKHICGAIFDCLAPEKNAIKPAGQWNHYKIVAKDNWIKVELNGEDVLSMNLDDWDEAGKNPDGSKNKFKYAYKEMSREGHIGLQYHGHPVWFRDIKIRELD